jgi:hypothetical protein
MTPIIILLALFRRLIVSRSPLIKYLLHIWVFNITITKATRRVTYTAAHFSFGRFAPYLGNSRVMYSHLAISVEPALNSEI